MNNSGVFRDLTKPIGAINQDRARIIQRRFTLPAQPNLCRFMHRTLYSSRRNVLFYLSRLAPFSTLAREDGSEPLRSMAAAWSRVNNDPDDVSELVPELFYLPEMLQGDPSATVEGARDDVLLPSWARDNVEFVRIQRAALESEYVSMNLHHWIDLVFGFKQTGRAAVEAQNVFMCQLGHRL
jgi:hypothetical protein